MIIMSSQTGKMRKAHFLGLQLQKYNCENHGIYPFSAKSSKEKVVHKNKLF